MFSDSVPASQIPALVLGIWTGSFESLTDRWHRRPQCENSWLLVWSQEKCREINWIYFFHVSPDEKLWSQNKKMPLQKKKKAKSFLKILVACYQHHHVYFKHLLPCLQLSIPWSIAWKWKYTSTKALREDDSLPFFSMELRHIALKSLKWSRV